MRKLNDAGGMLTNAFGMIIVLMIGFYITIVVVPDIIEDTNSIDTGLANDLNIYPVVSSFGTVSKVSGEITKFSSVDDSYLLNFKDDLSDYKFVDVDQTEWEFLQYAFENHNVVTLTYVVDGVVKSLEGVTLSSPSPPVAEVTSNDLTDDINWYILLMPTIICSASASFYFIHQNRRRRREIEEFEHRLARQQRERAIDIDDDAEVVKPASKTKKAKEEKEDQVIPFDGRYRIERADILLGEKKKRRRKE